MPKVTSRRSSEAPNATLWATRDTGFLRFSSTHVCTTSIGFATFSVPLQDVIFELVPLALMKDNPDGLDLATPSIAFHVENLEATHSTLPSRGVQASEMGEHSGVASFAFSDNEGRWFTVTRG